MQRTSKMFATGDLVTVLATETIHAAVFHRLIELLDYRLTSIALNLISIESMSLLSTTAAFPWEMS